MSRKISEIILLFLKNIVKMNKKYFRERTINHKKTRQNGQTKELCGR
jgi:hypothetical protein